MDGEIMEVIRCEEKERWNNIIKSFKNWDIYYLNEYAHSLELHGDGKPILLYFETQQGKMCYVMMQNDIADFKPFQNNLPSDTYFDWTTPYGYGGPLYDGILSDDWMKERLQEIKDYANKNHIISQFFRYHPLQQNQKIMENCSKVIYMKKTVFIDTESEDIIYKNMTPNNRNMVRKAQKNGIEIICDHGERIADFIKIYNETMKNHNADEYYYFDSSYFEFIKSQMRENTIFFYALYDEKIVSASIFFFNEQFMHYHLSGTLYEYRNLAATNLLLTEAAIWAAKHNIKYLHLGGGVENEDSLLRFKKHFNRNGQIDFCIGCNIFEQQKFEQLVELRKQIDKNFDDTKSFMIKYRG